MALYEIRFLKPDDSYTKTVEVELPTDYELSLFLGTTYPQKNIEVWHEGHRVRRHVSPAHDARLAGWWPRSCRYASLNVASYEKMYGELPFALLERLGGISNSVFSEFRHCMASHPIWIRASAHPQASRSFNFVCNFDFTLFAEHCGQLKGVTYARVVCREREGHDIADDLFEAAARALEEAHNRVPRIAAEGTGGGPRWTHAGDILRTAQLYWCVDKEDALEAVRY